ncbi:MAG: PASTA domain-containing protein [Marinagarivorans sp.]
MTELANIISDVVASPLGEVIAAVGQGVADAQQALDEGSLAKTLEIYSEGGSQMLQMLRDIGYNPTFYTLPETTGEVRIALRLGSNQTAAPSSTPQINASLARQGLNLPALTNKLYATPVDAGYANRFGYQADISAKLTFKIVPVPAPNGVDELRVVPNVVESKVGDANARLAALQLSVRWVDEKGEVLASVDDSQIVISQSPAGQGDRPAIVRAGQEITLQLKAL